MNLEMNQESQLLERAKTSTCPVELEKLHNSSSMNIRRAVARNINITTETANKLVKDPVLNVSFMASKNPKSSEKKDFDENSLNYCVLCEEDERYMNCSQCYEANNWSLLNS
ncbi:hypothetical protein [Arcobacter arenosus]|uniref:Uncharacterized protein n=1 Tax=Arcobacter arenosus TaxID=2576037 RepID=A0A5R8Y1V0_9BACT|nr:hypothetical protein [Arcobacter arenosus]TLP39234.1 hypothetical protein FDK22_05010 [Arcobacter arenosus]